METTKLIISIADSMAGLRKCTSLLLERTTAYKALTCGLRGVWTQSTFCFKHFAVYRRVRPLNHRTPYILLCISGGRFPRAMAPVLQDGQTMDSYLDAMEESKVQAVKDIEEPRNPEEAWQSV